MGKIFHSRKNFFEIVKRIFRNLAHSLAYSTIIITVIITLFSTVVIRNCSIVGSAANTIYGTGISYDVCSTDEGSKEFLEAEKLVQNFMGDKYIKPLEVKYVDIYSDAEIFGFQQYNRIYIQSNMSHEKTVEILVHELLHLQNEVGFDVTIDTNVTIGHNFTEAVVEKITCELTGSQPTKRIHLLEEYVDSSSIFIEAFRNKETEEEWSKNFDDDEIYELKYFEKQYSVKKYVVWLNAFDNWMIGCQKNFF